MTHQRTFCSTVFAILVALIGPGAVLSARAAEPLPSEAVLRQWVVEMKSAPRGPFKRLRWFCADGAVLPPNAGCSKHGGGNQHGEWTDRVVAMRAGGYMIANVLAEIDAERFVGPDADLLALQQILVERFLILADDGWIFRAARSYRGALQAEDEEEGSLRVLQAMFADSAWRDDARYFPLREAGRLLPYQTEATAGSATEVRQLAKVIADKDSSFEPLRIKIHGVPDAGDAATVREYARTKGRGSLAADYERLARGIDDLYQSRHAAASVRQLAGTLDDQNLAGQLRQLAGQLESESGAEGRLRAASRLIALLRLNAKSWTERGRGLGLIEASLELEKEIYTAGNTVLRTLGSASRRTRLYWLGHAANALYGTGLITLRHLSGLGKTLDEVTTQNEPTLDFYRERLRYLARVPEWADRTIVLHFSEGVQRLAPIEPLAHLFSQDRLRGSPVLFYGAVIDSLVKDANRLAGMEHELFGERVGAGLRALNPGLARGVLRIPRDLHDTEDFDPGGIYLLPETVSELPPVAGILTQGEGSSLSHVQLLARNLGIPNVVVVDTLLPRVRRHEGSRVALAVSPGGVVKLARDGPEWDRVFGKEGPPEEFVIRPDLKKLDLNVVELVPLTSLRATDSGRVAGPKSANLGELEHHFGAAVPPGLVIPFGAFRRLLDRPIEGRGPSVFEWMKERYRTIARLEGDPRAQQRTVREFLGKLRTWLETVDPGPDFRRRLASAMGTTFGRDGTYGVFVRSDTNVEDLPGFTGAGLNLTVPNVVGMANVMKAIGRVWASPFTERSYSWRQAHMEQPEYVFPAVLIQLAFPSEKSGVMVTTDVEGGRSGYLSVAVNEGVGGAVDGQAAESLLVNTDTGAVRFLAQATAPRRRVLDPGGGLTKVPATGTSAVLTEDEIAQLRDLARRAATLPTLRDEHGKSVPGDIEFGFRNGRLTLLQMRPFVESASAQRSSFLNELDAGLRRAGGRSVALDGIPEDRR